VGHALVLRTLPVRSMRSNRRRRPTQWPPQCRHASLRAPYGAATSPVRCGTGQPFHGRCDVDGSCPTSSRRGRLRRRTPRPPRTASRSAPGAARTWRAWHPASHPRPGHTAAGHRRSTSVVPIWW